MTDYPRNLLAASLYSFLGRAGLQADVVHGQNGAHCGAGLLQYGQVGDKASPGATAWAGGGDVFELLVTIWVFGGNVMWIASQDGDVIKCATAHSGYKLRL